MSNVILITGAPAVGKTTVAHLLAGQLDGTVARISGDVFVLGVTPFEISEDRRSFLRDNLASFARHAVAHGYDWVVLECVIPSDAFLDDLIAVVGLGCERFTVVSLVADRGAYEARLHAVLSDQGASPVDLTSCHEWMDRIAALSVPTRVDTSGATPDETAAEVRRLSTSNRR